MKTKTMALSLMLTFASCALFAQSNKDTIPKENTPQTDTIPKDSTPQTDKDQQKKDSTSSASATFQIRQKADLINFLKVNPADDQLMKNESAFSFISSEESDQI